MIMRIFYTLLLTNVTFISYAQLAIIGLNAETPDEILFVALDEIPAGETFHITDNEYDSILDEFTSGEGFVSFSSNAIVEKGDVFSIKNDGGWSIEGTSDITLGTVDGNLNFSLGNEQAYLFKTDDDTNSGSISTILAMVDTWTGVIPSSIDPKVNYPDANVIDLADNERNLTFDGDRETSEIDDIMDLNNWLLSSVRIDLDMTDFFNIIPVELTYFRGNEHSNGNLLQWETASEFDNEKFVIEKSRNGSDFVAIDFLLGHGTMNNSVQYEYMDDSPFIGYNYYRLKQVDFNGSYDYSEILILENLEEKTIDIFPSVVTESINVTISSSQANQLVVFDQSGKSIIQKAIGDGNNTINLSSLASGAYYMTVYLEDGPYVEKFIKQ